MPLQAGLRVESAEFAAALGSADTIASMRAYVAETERTVELPAYDGAALERGRMKSSD